MQVSDVAMTTDTGRGVGGGMFGRRPFDGFRNVCVTFATGFVGNFLVSFGDLNGVGIIAGGEIERVPETVLRLGGILAHKIRRGVTIVAGRHTPMARLDPAIVLLLHDVAIHARLGIVGEIRRALGVDEGVSTHAKRESHYRAKNNSSDGFAFHLRGM